MAWENKSFGVKGPCRDCGKRHATCHTDCEAYSTFVEGRREERERRMKAKEVDNAIFTAKIQGMVKTGYWRKRYHSKNK